MKKKKTKKIGASKSLSTDEDKSRKATQEMRVLKNKSVHVCVYRYKGKCEWDPEEKEKPNGDVLFGTWKKRNISLCQGDCHERCDFSKKVALGEIVYSMWEVELKHLDYVFCFKLVLQKNYISSLLFKSDSL